MKSITNLITEASSKIYVLYAAPKDIDSQEYKYFLNRITLGVYSSQSACQKDAEQFKKALPKVKGYESYVVNWYSSEMNVPLVDSDLID